MTPLPAVVHTRITHTRTTPIRHSFVYRSASWLIDIDNPPRPSWPLRVFARFVATDHFPEPAGPGDTLRSRLDAHLDAAGVVPPTGRVVALLSPRVAGHVFNPLSVYWCHDLDGTLRCVVAEVHNTYGERHCYVTTPDARGDAQVRKEFYVSPFNDVDGTYRLHVPEPGPEGRVAVSIILDREGQGSFVASLAGQARPATVRAILTTQIVAPLAPLLVTARIRIQGIRLWLRRIPVITRPVHDHPTTVADDSLHTSSRKDFDERSAS
jgi:uncharacterized protein